MAMTLEEWYMGIRAGLKEALVENKEKYESTGCLESKGRYLELKELVKGVSMTILVDKLEKEMLGGKSDG